MNIGDIFRSLFGLSRRNNEWRDSHDGFFGDIDDHGGDDDDTEGIFFSFGSFPRQEGLMEDVFASLHSDMEQQMKEMNKQMEEMFHQFGVGNFSGPGSPDRHMRENPRDLMLKEPDCQRNEVPPSTIQKPIDNKIVPHQHERLNPPSLFRGFFGPRLIKIFDIEEENREDEDLNKDMTSNDVVQLFEKPKNNNIQPGFVPHGFSSSGSSVSITTMQGRDGKSEIWKTVSDSSGQSETTVTRSIGGKSHSVTTRTDNSGLQEKQEHFSNMDEKDLEDFNDKWNSQPSGEDCKPCQQDFSHDMTVPKQINTILNKFLDWDIFKPK